MTDLPSGMPALIDKKVKEALVEERKMIVDWLCSEAEKHDAKTGSNPCFQSWSAYTYAAVIILRDEYRKGAGG